MIRTPLINAVRGPDFRLADRERYVDPIFRVQDIFPELSNACIGIPVVRCGCRDAASVSAVCPAADWASSLQHPLIDFAYQKGPSV
jgi:hypothetical protein